MASAPVMLVELFYDGVWNNVTSDVYEGTAVITRGRASVDQQAASQSLSCTFKNDNGKYSPRNPGSPLFGKIGRNTPIRATVSTSSRFYGEVASWEPTWNENHTMKAVPIVANGILRRMGQGSTPASIALRDFILSQANLPATYFPLSGADGTTYSVNQGKLSTNSTRFYGVTAPGPGPVFKYGQDMPDWIGTGMLLDATGTTSYMEGASGAAATNVAFDFVFRSNGPEGIGVLDVRLFDTKDSYWNLRLNTSADDGTVQMSHYDDATGLTTDIPSLAIPALQDGGLHHCRILLKTVSGPLIGYVVYIDGDIKMAGNSLAIGSTLQGLYLFRLYYSRFTAQTTMTLAHVAVWADSTLANIVDVAAAVSAALGYVGETAADRITRIAALAGTTATIVGTAAATTPMGAQVAETRLQQLRDAEQTDFGILTESRNAFALLYRTRASMYNQTPVAVLDYAGRQVAPPFQPVDDDQQTRNDVTASRRGGGDYRLVKTSGALSTLAPPNGVGPYEDGVTVNLVSDEGLPGAAAWWLNQGTIDEPRFPQIAVNLAISDINDAKATTLRALDVGDLLQVINVGAADITTDIMLIVLGYTETVKDLQHQLTFNCVTATGYTFAKWGSAAGSGPDRWDTEYSTLTSSVTSTAPSFQVTSPSTALWTTNGAEFPFDIYLAGERMTVTNITGASSPQTFTVARSQNGVSKAQASGAPVRLWRTPRYGY